MTKEQAIEWAGGTQWKLARKLGIYQSTVSEWPDFPPDLWQLRIEHLSGGELKAEPTALKPKRRKAA